MPDSSFTAGAWIDGGTGSVFKTAAEALSRVLDYTNRWLQVSVVDGGSVSQAAASGHVHEPAADTAAVVTLVAAGTGVSNVLALAAWSYDADPTAGTLTIEDGSGTTVFKVDITTGGPGFFPFTPPLKGTTNTALIATLAAGGATVNGIISVHAWTE